jgi:hypothetical protein
VQTYVVTHVKRVITVQAFYIQSSLKHLTFQMYIKMFLNKMDQGIHYVIIYREQLYLPTHTQPCVWPTLFIKTSLQFRKLLFMLL